MKIICFPLFLFFILSCSSSTVTNKLPQSTGWIDNDTYMVRVSGDTEQKAVENAKHRILKDIVDVRIRNKSRYTDIVKIKEEFDLPLRRGSITKKIMIPGGIDIIFQIRDTNLRNKFMKQ